MAGTRTSYTYDWWEDARQATIVFDSDTGSGSNPLNTSTFAYDLNGRIASVYIADARPRTVTFITDAQGQVLSRTEQDNNPNLADPKDQYFYFNGQRIGQVTNNTEYTSTYHGEMYKRGWTGPTSPTPFRNGNYAQYGVDFDLAYEALTPNSVRSTGQSWTVRDGDTLQGIAAAVWGDAALWYLIAEHNGLTSASILTAGQTLTVPAKVGNVHNTSETFRPYDPNKAMGDLSPTQPRPPKKPGGCGVIGQVIMVAIAVAVAAVVLGPIAGALAGPAGTTIGLATATTTAATATAAATTTYALTAAGAFVAGAAAGAAASIASQAFGLATGMQDRFDWKGLALAAVSGGVGSGLGTVSSLAGNGFGIGLVRGAISNVLTQGVAVATGLQDSFNWTDVAVSAVMSGVGSKLGPKGDPASWTARDYGRAALANTASAGAGAAVESLINGSSFGDNLIANLPQAIGQTIGNMVAGGIGELEERRNDVQYATEFANEIDEISPFTPQERTEYMRSVIEDRREVRRLTALGRVDEAGDLSQASTDRYISAIGRTAAGQQALTERSILVSNPSDYQFHKSQEYIKSA